MYQFLLPYIRNYLTGIDGNWVRLPDSFLLEMAVFAISGLEARTRFSFRWRNIVGIHTSDKTFGSFEVDSDLKITNPSWTSVLPGGTVEDASGRRFVFNGIGPDGTLLNVYPDPLQFTPQNPLRIVADATELGYDYEWDDMLTPTIDLNQRPVRQVHEVNVQLVNLRMITVPNNWVQVHDSGFSVVPFSAPGFIFGAALVPFGGGHIPGGWNVKYSAGVLPHEFDGRWGDLRVLAVKAAVVEVLKAVREGRHPGLVSVGIAQMGVSEGFSRFAQTIQTLEMDIERILSTLSGSYIFVA
jgi:hypothetical protein